MGFVRNAAEAQAGKKIERAGQGTEPFDKLICPKRACRAEIGRAHV